MKLTTTENGIKKLVPENGMFLTDGETIAEGEVTGEHTSELQSLISP